MAGVGIRATEFARQLARHGDVTLAAIPGSENPLPDVGFVIYEHGDPSALRPFIARADVVVVQPTWPILMGWLKASGARLIFDMYVPELFEVLESWADASAPFRELLASMIVDRAIDAFHIGHHFLCASDKQKDLWIGAMFAERLIRFGSYARDTSFESVIRVVPFGLSSTPPQPSDRPVIREKFPQIRPGDEIILWNGGLWGWLDPATAIRAVAALRSRRSGVRLVFMGAATNRPAMRATQEARALAAELGVLDTHVLFNDEWVPFDRRGDWLLEADCAVSCHEEHLETRFAFRTRLLDCFWSGLPVVCTAGDDLASLVEREDVGRTVPPRDAATLADALDAVLDAGRASYADRLAAVADAFTWERVTRPLVDFARDERAPVRLGQGLAASAARRPAQRARALGYRVARTGLNRVGLRNWPLQGRQED